MGHLEHVRDRGAVRASCTTTVRGVASGTAQAELVTLRVGQDVPAPSSLPDIHLPSAEREQPVKFCQLIAVDRLDVQVQPILDGLRVTSQAPC